MYNEAWEHAGTVWEQVMDPLVVNYSLVTKLGFSGLWRFYTVDMN